MQGTEVAEAFMENACMCYLNGLIVALCVMAHYVMAQLLRRPILNLFCGWR